MFDGVPRPSRRSAIAALLMAGAGVSCGDVKVDVAFSAADPALDEPAERYVRLTLRLAQHQPSLVETWVGHGAWRPGWREPVAGTRKEIVEADAALARVSVLPEDRQRHRYLAGQFKALVTAARRLSGETMRFTDEAEAAFGITPRAATERTTPALDGTGPRDNASTVAAARAALEGRLAGRGALHERYAAFRQRHAVSDPRVLPAFLAALNACRARVLRHIRLPNTERVEVEVATGRGWEARAVYQGDFRTRVTIDNSGAIDLARLVWLAAHETYPGHHTQHVLADRVCVQERGWHERALHPAFGPHLLWSEGLAEAGAALLLDGEEYEDVCRETAPVAGVSPARLSELIAVHRAVAALDIAVPAIAQAYLDGEIGSEAAAARLAEDALVASPQQFLSIIERQRTRLLAYPVGRRLAVAAISGVAPERRWRGLTELATTLMPDR
jgi:hypothetical protein